jgi:hypothetical protein
VLFALVTRVATRGVRLRRWAQSHAVQKAAQQQQCARSAALCGTRQGGCLRRAARIAPSLMSSLSPLAYVNVATAASPFAHYIAGSIVKKKKKKKTASF